MHLISITDTKLQELKTTSAIPDNKLLALLSKTVQTEYTMEFTKVTSITFGNWSACVYLKHKGNKLAINYVVPPMDRR